MLCCIKNTAHRIKSQKINGELKKNVEIQSFEKKYAQLFPPKNSIHEHTTQTIDTPKHGVGGVGKQFHSGNMSYSSKIVAFFIEMHNKLK